MARSHKEKYLGMENTNNQGCRMKIIEYYNFNNITVQFEDNTIVYNRGIVEFKNGSIRNTRIPTFKEKCKQAKINESLAGPYKRRHPELTDEQVIELYKNGFITFRGKCRLANVNITAAESYKQSHPELTDEQVIEYIKNRLTFREKCRQANIVNITAAEAYKHLHPELTEEQIIDYYVSKDIKIHFSDKCSKAGIYTRTAQSYKQNHTELTDNQVICLYNPNCYINILGQLVIPQEDGTKIVLA